MKEEARSAGVAAWRRFGAGIGKVWRGAGRAAARAVAAPVRWLTRRRWTAAAVVLVAVAAAVSWALWPWGALSRGVGWQPLILQRVGGDELPLQAASPPVPDGGQRSQAAGPDRKPSETGSGPARAGAASAAADGQVKEKPASEPARGAADVAITVSAPRQGAAADRGQGEAAAQAVVPPDAALATPRPLTLAPPTADGVVIRGRGWYRHPVYRDWRFHPGVELEVAPGSPVAAALGGVVVAAGPDERWGLTVRVQHGNGWQTVYGYLQSVVVQEGQEVAAGDSVGVAGFSPWGDPRLFFAVWKDGISVDPLPLLSR